ncbi:tetratricopeptide repeat protein [Cerasicoccus arenae]|uniref:Tetratricopeptide repeat protein n=1 Tax=Cerasicoccus arenae TaxID=424488 RepID=A0A8J3DBQ1_9BACT|nr:tetratricopeptide repeat protein [Cerasicoccus arenae]MBK1857196.1 tetratricopeptide repeat protein [Cerasicoccus arenae]GHB99926.1 hypothetical protein GCM10007047_15160 [Cerasicoccus arenae]
MLLGNTPFSVSFRCWGSSLAVQARHGRILIVGFFLLSLNLLWADAQAESFPELDLQTLATRAEATFQTNPGEAIPYMKEIKHRLKIAAREDYRAIYRENLYMLGLAHMRWYQQGGDVVHLKDGIPYWTEFINSYASDDRNLLAMLNLADSYFGVEDWKKAFDAYMHILDVYSLQVESEELIGLLERLNVSAASSDRLSEAGVVLWKFTAPGFDYSVRLYCLNVLFDAALDLGNLNALLRLVVLINQDAQFRYDLGINLRLLNAGDRFEDEERYLDANMLFAMVLPSEQLLAVVEDRLIDVEEQLFRGQFIGSKKIALNEEREALLVQRADLIAAPKYTANLRWRQARVLRLMNRIYEAYFGFRRLIEDYPQHEHTEQFRYAAFLQGLECGYWQEAVGIGEAYLNEPAFILYEKPIAARLARLYAQAGEVEKLALLADEFLHRFPDDPISAQVAHSLGQVLFAKEQTERILQTFPSWATEFPDGAFIDSVNYWSGMAYLFVGDFVAALKCFDTLIQTSPGSIYINEVRFRRGVSYFGMGDYETARTIFTEWISGVQDHPLLPEAHAFLGDLDAMDAEVEGALAHYRMIESLGGSPALIDHGYFESATLLSANQRYKELYVLLEGYLERYPDSPAAAEAVLRLADADQAQGRIRNVIARYQDGVARYGNLLDSDSIDQIIDAWWNIDASVRTTHQETTEMILRLKTDPKFLKQMLYDRVAQIQYFNEHPVLPQDLQETLIEIATEYPGSGELPDLANHEGLRVIQRRVDARLGQLPGESLTSTFTQMYGETKESNDRTLSLRLLRVLNLRIGLIVNPGEITKEDVEAASPRTKVWMASIVAEDNPILAEDILLQIVHAGGDSQAVADALFALGELDMLVAYYDSAARYFELVLENYFDHELAPKAAILRGDALRLGKRYEEAIEAYSDILNQRSWRGEIWAEATFKIGECFIQLNENGKAQGFFERTYLAYSGYPEWAGEAVLASADLLQEAGDTESARRTYEFFLSSPKAAESSKVETIRQELLSL